jgi:hypothetical protein
MERGEGYLTAPRLQVQAYHVVKCADPTTCARVSGGNEREIANGECARVVGGRVGRIRKRRLPQFDVGFRGMEFDAGEEVSPCPINPRFGDDATGFERKRFIV